MGSSSRMVTAWVALSLACSSSDGRNADGDATSATTTGLTATTGLTDGGSEEETTGDEDTSTSDDGGVKLDTPEEDTAITAGDAGDEGCIGVDILFIIDNSASMADDQEQLAAAFPSFVDQIFAALEPGVSLHIGVTTTSGFWTGPGTENTTECVSSYSASEIMGFYEPPDGGVTINGTKGTLYSHFGQRYFEIDTDQDPEPLKTWFSEAALRGENGNNVEMPTAAAGWAVDPINDGTNEGFLRDEGAVLVIFFITDEPDKTPEPVQPFIDQVLAAKQQCGGADCIVTAGAVPTYCFEHPNDTTLYDFMHGFGKPPAALVTIPEPFIDPPPGPPDYSQVLGQALSDVIASTCEEIPTPG